jgi:hypothetical protein
MADEKTEIGASSTKDQSRPHEAYPELASVIRTIEMHDGNPIWLTKLRNEIDAALATERNRSYQLGRQDEADTVAAAMA